MIQVHYQAHMPLIELLLDNTLIISESIDDLLREASNAPFFGLHIEEQGSYSTFRSVKRQREYAASRYLAKEVLARFTNTAPSDWHISRHNSGAALPICSKQPISQKLFLSISHSANHCAVAVSRQAIGIDLQTIEPLERWKKIQTMVFSAEEVSKISLLNKSEQALRFTELWALKEALGKLHGTGLKPKGNRNLSFELQKSSVVYDATTFQHDKYVLAISTDGEQPWTTNLSQHDRKCWLISANLETKI